ncbi:GNAT family N-acetyltransferase [Photorhabdus viridis]|uniref:GNAT family N-acetyltransferase n=1 Tax=Photorhabdus viridis TaxID=3163327 RepID=UPI003306DDBB
MIGSYGEKWKVNRADISQWENVLYWARNEKWDIGVNDVTHFFNVDPNGFFMGYLGDIPISAVSIVNYSDNYAHLGHYLVSPEYRGLGLGLKVWSTAFEHAANRCIGLDGMPAQESNYEKWGFKTHYRTLRFSGNILRKYSCPEEITVVDESLLSNVIQYDTQCTGIVRSRLFSGWFYHYGRKGFVSMGSQGVNGVLGLRASTDGYRLGPFYADNERVMESLFHAAIAEISVGTRITVDIPEMATDFIELATSYGLCEIFYTFRMYRGVPPQQNDKSIKSIASLELG